MSLNVDALYAKRDELKVSLSGSLKTGSMAMIGVGAAALIGGFALHPAERVWGSILFNLYFFFAIALGASALGGMQDIVGAVWGRPMRKIQEAFASFVPLGCVFFVVFLLCVFFNVKGAGDLYVWMVDPHMLDHFWGKNIWLQKTPFVVRNLAIVVGIFLLWRWQSRITKLRDQEFMSGDQAKSKQMGVAARDKLRFWSAPFLIAYAVLYTFLGFDLLMSLSPLWFSTLWGGWLFAVMMQTLLAALLITLFAMKKTPVGEYINRLQFHDTGKLLHGFTVFFAYLTFAHVLTYWYANMPETTEYYIHRLHAPWLYIVLFAPLFNFVIPLFAFLVKRFKWVAGAAIPLSVGILIAQWFVYLLIVMPEAKTDSLSMPVAEVGGLLLFLGLFIMSFGRFASTNPMLPVADPLLPEAYEEHH